MKINKENMLSFGIILEASASKLTQGNWGDYYEASGFQRRPPS